MKLSQDSSGRLAAVDGGGKLRPVLAYSTDDSQVHLRRSFDHFISHLVVKIEVQCRGEKYTSSGFVLTSGKPAEKGWQEIGELLVVTNRHCLFGCDEGAKSEISPESVEIFLRDERFDGNERQLLLTEAELAGKTRVYRDQQVDIAVIDISSILKVPAEEAPLATISSAAELRNSILNRIYLPVESGSDVLVVGYPEELYDRHNNFPIVKNGIIASGFGLHFEEEPRFLIDSNLFLGSSGSVVISKPVEASFVTGSPMVNTKGPQFIFLGIYSDEITTHGEAEGDKVYPGLGSVWYPEAIDEVIANGCRWSPVSLGE